MKIYAEYTQDTHKIRNTGERPQCCIAQTKTGDFGLE
jgi:hypothetical protein